MADVFGRVHAITDFLYLSGAAGARRDHIRERGITCVINCTVELPNLPLTNVEFINVRVDDSPYAIIGRYFDACSDKIEEHRLAGTHNLGTCYAMLQGKVLLRATWRADGSVFLSAANDPLSA